MDINNSLLRHASTPANTPTRPATKALPLVREYRRLLPRLNRHLSEIDPKLLKVFGDLADGREAWPLFLWGQPGRGKTCAALTLADIVESASYHTAEGLADFTLKRGAEVDDEYERIAGKDLAILDELGTRMNVGDLGYAVVKRFADARETQANRMSIYISNVAPQELPALYDDRLASRLLCGTVFELVGADRRRVN